MYYGNNIIVSFPRYAGGKFVINCLNLSRYFLMNLNSKEKLQYLIQNPLDYNYRLQHILLTLPKESHMSDWVDYELYEPHPNMKIYKEAQEKGFRIASTMHSLNKKLIDDWPNCIIIKLINYQDFRSISIQKKQPTMDISFDEDETNYNLLRGDSWPSFNIMQGAGFNTKFLSNKFKPCINEINRYYKFGSIENKMFLYDVSKIFNKFKFLEHMKSLYKYLSLDDFNEELISIYFKNYIKLHF